MSRLFRNITFFFLGILIAIVVGTSAATAGEYGGTKAKAGAASQSAGIAVIETNTKNQAPDFSERVPDVTVVAPATANRCTFSIGGAITVAGFGGGATGTYTDETCVRARDSQILHSQGHKEAAKELLCDDPKVYAAFQRAGKPCTVREELAGEAAEINTTRPTPRVNKYKQRREAREAWEESLG